MSIDRVPVGTEDAPFVFEDEIGPGEIPEKFKKENE